MCRTAFRAGFEGLAARTPGPRHYDRRLLLVFYVSSLSSLKSCPASRAYYDRKRAEGKSHIQALLSPARRRLNVVWVLLRDGTTYIPLPHRRPCRLPDGVVSELRIGCERHLPRNLGLAAAFGAALGPPAVLRYEAKP